MKYTPTDLRGMSTANAPTCWVIERQFDGGPRFLNIGVTGPFSAGKWEESFELATKFFDRASAEGAMSACSTTRQITVTEHQVG